MNTSKHILSGSTLNNPRISEAGIKSRQLLFNLVKEKPGLPSSEYARIMDRNPSDINRLLRELANKGFLYSKPKKPYSRTGVTSHNEWYVNELDHNKTKTKLLCKPWDLNLMN